MNSKSLFRIPRVFLASAALLAYAPLSSAATLQWDANGVAPLGGAGTWNTTAANWFGSSYVPWINNGQVPGTTDDAVFGTTAGAVTLAVGGITARSLTFNIGGYALSGGALTLSGGTVINTNHSTSAAGTFATGANVTTISSIISGSGGLTKQGAGVLSVNTAAGYTGATVVIGGVLRMGIANALPSSTLLEVQTGAALDLGGNSTIAGFNLEVAGLTGGGRITNGFNSNPGNTLTVNIAGSRTDTFSGIFGAAQAGIGGTTNNQFNQIHLTKSGSGTLVMSGTSGTATAGNGPGNNVTVNGGILQLGSQTAFTAVGWDLNTLAVGTGATFDMNGFNEGFSGTSGVGVVTNSNNSTQSVMSRNRAAATTWATQITGNIRVQANSADVTLSNTGNSFTGGVDLTSGGGAFLISNAGQLPANQIDLANGGNLDFTAAGGLTLDNTRTFTIGAGISNFRYRNTATGVVNLAGAINNGTSPGTLVLSYHTSVVGNTTFNFSGGGNFTGTTQIGTNHASPQSVTLRVGAANGIATGTIIDFGGGNARTYSLDLNGFNQQVAGLTNTGTGTTLVQRVITSSAAASQVFTVNNAADHIFSGTLGGVNTNNNNFGFTKSGVGSLTLFGANTYTGNTTVSAGALNIANASGLGGTPNVVIGTGGTLNYIANANSPLTTGTGSTLSITGGTGTSIGGSIGSTSNGTRMIFNGAGSATGAISVNVFGVSGVTTGTTGTYILASAASGTLNSGTYTLGNVYNNTNFTVTSVGATSNSITADIASATALTTAFWKGGLAGATNVWAASDGSANSNWTATAGGSVQALIPGSGADVTISATSPTTAPTATVLGANMSINSLTIADTTNGLGLNADGYALTISTGGITMNASVPASTIAANVVLGASQAWTNNSTNLLTFSGGISGANNLTVAGSGNTTISGTIATGAGTVTKTGAGSLNLTGTNTYTGATAISAGTLSLTGSLTGSNVSTSGTGILNQAASGVINGGGVMLTQGSSGTSILAGANTYTGATTVTGGTLQLGATNRIADTSNLVVNGGIFNLVGFNDTVGTVTMSSGSIIGTGTLTGSSYALQGGTVNAILGGSGPITVSSGTTALGSAGRLGTGKALTVSSGQLTLGGNEAVATYQQTGGTLAGAFTLTSTAAYDMQAGTVNANLGGTIGLNKTTSGTATLSGTNTYTGATTVSNGTLLVNGSLAAGSAVSVASGATLGGSGTISGTTTILIGATLSPGTSPGLSTMGSTTLNTGSDFVFELIGNTTAGRGTNYDGVNILAASTLTIQSGVTSSLVFNAGSTVNWSDTFWATDQQWLVFDTADNNYSGPLFGSLTLTTDSASQSLASIRSAASFNYSVVSGDIFLNYTAIPEPSTYAMLGLGLAALVWLRRKNKNNKA